MSAAARLVHIRSLGGMTTLCGEAIYRVWSAVTFADRPDPDVGCPACLEIAGRVDEALGRWGSA